jgi:translation initiation factor 2 subunit 2
MDYEAMLSRGQENLPDDTSKGSRFTIPKVKGHLQGNKTVISNLTEIAKILGRKLDFIVKYVEKQLATKAIIEGSFVIFNTKLSAAKINTRVQEFADQLVICKECGKPETKLSKDTGVYFIKCQACGAKYSVKSRV